MFKNLTYKKKNQLLIAGAALAVFIVYSFAIKKTIIVYEKYSDAEHKIEFATNAPTKASQLEKELAVMDEKIGNQNRNGQNSSQVLLELVTNYCEKNHAILRDFPELTIANKEKLDVETNRFIVEGHFSTLINLVYNLEQKNKLGKVASVRYQLKKDFKTREMALTTTIYLQNIKKK